MIGDFLLMSVARVSQCDKEFTTREGEEVVSDVAFNVIVLPNLAGLPLSINLCNQ